MMASKDKKKLRWKFLILTIIGACGALFVLYIPIPDAPLYQALQVGIFVLFVLTCSISGGGLFANLLQWITEADEE